MTVGSKRRDRTEGNDGKKKEEVSERRRSPFVDDRRSLELVEGVSVRAPCRVVGRLYEMTYVPIEGLWTTIPDLPLDTQR